MTLKKIKHFFWNSKWSTWTTVAESLFYLSRHVKQSSCLNTYIHINIINELHSEQNPTSINGSKTSLHRCLLTNTFYPLAPVPALGMVTLRPPMSPDFLPVLLPKCGARHLAGISGLLQDSRESCIWQPCFWGNLALDTKLFLLQIYYL